MLVHVQVCDQKGSDAMLTVKTPEVKPKNPFQGGYESHE